MLELGLAGVPIVSMLACGEKGLLKISNNELSEAEAKLYFNNLCLRWYQLAAYMPALHSDYGSEKYNTILTDNTNYKWIKRSLDHRIMVSWIYFDTYLATFYSLQFIA